MIRCLVNDLGSDVDELVQSNCNVYGYRPVCIAAQGVNIRYLSMCLVVQLELALRFGGSDIDMQLLSVTRLQWPSRIVTIRHMDDKYAYFGR
jgi:hypothetical protein